jgi:hypothetical protein
VLLEYQNHEFEGAVAADVTSHIIELFDHFLRDTPAPQWWSEGLSRDAGQVPAR